MLSNRSIGYDGPAMARTNEYPHWRYLAMQATMWVLLVCSVGVAALVSWDKRRSGAGELTQVVELDAFTAKVPSRWRISDSDSAGQFTTVLITEPTRPPLARRIAITERDPRKGNLLEKMFGVGDDTVRGRGRREQAIPFGETGTGHLGVFRTSLPAEVEFEAEQVHIIASGDLGGGPTMTITLDMLQVNGRPSLEQSVDLVKRIAASARPSLGDKGPTIGPQ